MYSMYFTISAITTKQFSDCYRFCFQRFCASSIFAYKIPSQLYGEILPASPFTCMVKFPCELPACAAKILAGDDEFVAQQLIEADGCRSSTPSYLLLSVSAGPGITA